ncbi:MAG: amidohydrolase [Alphaproteobacteria bacterium]|nr:amidohydrolase [Alphaproteobacteria bacterium]
MHRLWLVIVSALALMGSAQAAERLPIFDTHVHYSNPAWKPFPPKKAIAVLREAGVTKALVSSTPDDGSLTLQRHAPSIVTPVLRPYRGTIGSGNWTRDPGVVEYLAERLKKTRYAGIGEFHLFDSSEVDGPTVRGTVALARRYDVMIHVHSGAAPIEALFRVDPGVKILWAHAGMSEPASVVAAMLERFPTLWTEVSFRSGDIAPGGTLSAEWREVLIKYSKRIMIGSDTYITPRWESYARLIDEHRRWLEQLPRDHAEAIAFRNASALYRIRPATSAARSTTRQ